MLYVDTAYDPDVPTAHERPTAMDPSLVLEQVLTRSSADISATEMRERERDNSINPARRWPTALSGRMLMLTRTLD